VVADIFFHFSRQGVDHPKGEKEVQGRSSPRPVGCSASQLVSQSVSAWPSSHSAQDGHTRGHLVEPGVVGEGHLGTTVHLANRIAKVPGVSGRGKQDSDGGEGPNVGPVVSRSGVSAAQGEAGAHQKRGGVAKCSGEGKVNTGGGVARGHIRRGDEAGVERGSVLSDGAIGAMGAVAHELVKVRNTGAAIQARV